MGTTLTAGVLGATTRSCVGHVGDSRGVPAARRRARADHDRPQPRRGADRGRRAHRGGGRDRPAPLDDHRALGLDAGVEVDVEPVDLRAGDRLLLCSDGLTDMLNEGDDRRRWCRRGRPARRRERARRGGERRGRRRQHHRRRHRHRGRARTARTATTPTTTTRRCSRTCTRERRGRRSPTTRSPTSRSQRRRARHPRTRPSLGVDSGACSDAGSEPTRSAAQRRAAPRAVAVGITCSATCWCSSPTTPNLPPDLWAFVAVDGRAVRGRALRGPRARAARRPGAPAPRGAAQRHRVRHDLPPRPRPGAGAGGVDGRGRRRVRRHAARRAAGAHPRALPLHVPVRSASSRCCCRSLPGHRQDDQRRAALGRHRSAQLPARRGRQGAARHLLRGVSRRQARAARERQPPPRPDRCSPTRSYLGPLLLGWGVSILIMVQQKDLGSSLLFFAVFAAMLYIATERASYLIMGSCCSSAAPRSRTSSSTTCRTVSASGANPWPVYEDKGFQIVQSMFALRHRRVHRHRPRPRQPAADPERADRLRVLRDRRGARPARDGRGARGDPPLRRHGLPHRGRRPTARSRSCSRPGSRPSSASRPS